MTTLVFNPFSGQNIRYFIIFATVSVFTVPEYIYTLYATSLIATVIASYADYKNGKNQKRNKYGFILSMIFNICIYFIVYSFMTIISGSIMMANFPLWCLIGTTAYFIEVKNMFFN